MYTTTSPRPKPPTDTPRAGAVLAVPLLLAALFVVLSYPLYALGATVAVVVGTKLLQRGLAAFVARHRDRVREIPLPGVGSVRFRISPR